MVSLAAGLNMEGSVKWRGLKARGPLYLDMYIHCITHVTNRNA